jgi:hypothetical protein
LVWTIPHLLAIVQYCSWGTPSELQHNNEYTCTFLSYISPHWAMLHLPELCCTLIATLRPTKLCCIQLSYTTPYLNYAAP